MKKKKIKVLHLTTHVGGGVGTVLFNYFKKTKNDSTCTHELRILGYADDRAKEAQKEIGFSMKENMAHKRAALLAEIAEADILLIHWWNHPLMSDFLVRETLPPCRVAIWCHIAGMEAPNNLTEKILTYPDRFVFTTPLTYEAPEVRKLSPSDRKKLRDVWSTGGLKHLKHVRVKDQDVFNIGYVGSVDYAKMHSKFVQISSAVRVPGAHFTVIGGPNHESLKQEVYKHGATSRFTFTGFLSGDSKWDYFSTFQVFGYPLTSHHYGTCDQSLQEAMAIGSVPVVLSNAMERSMVKHGVTGLVVPNEKGYAKAIESLYHDPLLRKKLSRGARTYAFRNFSIEKVVRDWHKIFREILKEPQKVRSWKLNIPREELTPAHVFLESLGKHARPFAALIKPKTRLIRTQAEQALARLARAPQWQSDTKSTVHNFNHFLPGDKHLAKWSQLMRHAERRTKKS